MIDGYSSCFHQMSKLFSIIYAKQRPLKTPQEAPRLGAPPRTAPAFIHRARGPHQPPARLTPSRKRIHLIGSGPVGSPVGSVGPVGSGRSGSGRVGRDGTARNRTGGVGPRALGAGWVLFGEVRRLEGLSEGPRQVSFETKVAPTPTSPPSEKIRLGCGVSRPCSMVKMIPKCIGLLGRGRRRYSAKSHVIGHRSEFMRQRAACGSL